MIIELDENFSALQVYLNESSFDQLFFLVDENTHQYCLPLILSNLETDIPFEIVEIESGEEMKNIQTATQLWEILTEMNATRNSLLINVGGGVITDMGGFVASTYKRGIAFINVPTTLLAMVDASIGGKTGIDLLHYKNIVGTFAQPEHIMVFQGFLRTLDYTQLRSGFAEMLKHGLIYNREHWSNLSDLRELDADQLLDMIPVSMNIKQEVVDQDFDEKNIRKILNFGHTIGHAVESLFLQKGNPIFHGEAVAIGMICESHLAYLEGLLDLESHQHIVHIIQKFFPYITISHLYNDEILALMAHDKKNTSNTINFSLINSIGSCIYNHHSNEENITKALEFYRNLRHKES